MTFDQSVLIWCLLVPLVITVAAALLAIWIVRRNHDSAVAGRLATAAIGLSWCGAVWLSVSARQDWQFYPEEFWRQGTIVLVGWAIWSAWCGQAADYGWLWVGAGLLAIASAAASLPTGENWQDTYPAHRGWMTAISAACLLNSWSLAVLIHRGAAAWAPLVALAALGGPTILAASTYASLAERGLAAIASTAAICLFALATRRPAMAAASLPALTLAAGLTAAGDFYSYLEHPQPLFAAILFLPSIVAMIDWPLRSKNGWLRSAVAAIVSATIVGISLWLILIRETESW